MAANKVGDIIILMATGEFYPCIECIVMEVCPESGRATKIKAINPDPRLARHGFLIEGDDYVAIEWRWSEN